MKPEVGGGAFPPASAGGFRGLRWRLLAVLVRQLPQAAFVVWTKGDRTHAVTATRRSEGLPEAAE